jgi:hypothetical protein
MEGEIRKIIADRHDDFRADVEIWLARAGFRVTGEKL